MSNSRISPAPLQQALKELVIEWERTQVTWRDLKSQEFAQKYLSELPHQINQATEVLQELDGILRKVRTDCE